MKFFSKIIIIAAMVFSGVLAPVSVGISETSLAYQPFELVLSTVDAANDADFLGITCGTIDIFCGVQKAFLYVFNLIWYQTTQVLAFLAAFTLDILLFHSISSATYRTGIIEAGWEILRNFTNIIFIFSLMTIAFKMVFGAGGETKKTLMKTLGIALVINFSLFTTYVIIDASNILGNVFYSRVSVEGQNDNEETMIGSFLKDQEFQSPSAAIISKFEPQRIITKAGTGLGFFEKFLVIFSAGGINILIITIFVSIILLFLGRTVGLILLSILSPIAFATLTVPSKGIADMDWVGFNKWLKELISLSFMAPVYLFFLYLIVVFANSDALFNSISISGDASSGGPGNIINLILSVLIPFAIIATLLYTVKKISTTMAGRIGSTVSSFASKGLTGAAVVASGGAALLASGAGLGARAVGKIGGSEKWANRGKALQTKKFDVSKIPGFKKTFGENTFASKAAKGIGSTSYADIQTAAVKGISKTKDAYSNLTSGDIPDSVLAWQKNVSGVKQKNAVRDLTSAFNSDEDLKKFKNTVADAKLNMEIAKSDPLKKNLNGETYEEETKQTKILEELVKESRKKYAQASLSGNAAAKIKAKKELDSAEKSRDGHKKNTFEGQIKGAEEEVTRRGNEVREDVANRFKDNKGGETSISRKIKRKQINPEKKDGESKDK